MKNTVYLFPPSNGCEVARWLISYYGLDVELKNYTVPFFNIAIKKTGGSNFPFLIYNEKNMSGSLEISVELDALMPADKQLYPQDPQHRQQVTALWNDFIHPKLTFAVSRWAYYYLLPHKKLLLVPLTKDTSCWQRGFVWLFYPLLAKLLASKLGINFDKEPNKEAADIEEVFDRIDTLLADGRKYLTGDTLTIADLGFATLAAPVILHPDFGHGELMPNLDQTPEAMQPFVKAMQKRPAAEFIRRIYRDYQK